MAITISKNRNKDFDLTGAKIPVLRKGDFEDLEEIESAVLANFRRLNRILNELRPADQVSDKEGLREFYVRLDDKGLIPPFGTVLARSEEMISDYGRIAKGDQIIRVREVAPPMSLEGRIQEIQMGAGDPDHPGNDFRSLRDDFARTALLALIPLEAGVQHPSYQDIPKAAYAIADAMMNFRK